MCAFKILARNKHGVGVTLRLLSQADVEDHTPLDWAADTGDVNQLEFLLRQGLDLHRVDVEGRGALFWAVRSSRVTAARFLVRCGCDPHQADRCGQTPWEIARKAGNWELLEALTVFSSDITTVSAPLSGDEESFPDKPDIQPIWLVGRGALPGPQRSLAIYRHCPSRLSYVLLYGAVVFVVWMLSLVIPFYIWILCTGTMLLTFRCFWFFVSDILFFHQVLLSLVDISKITHRRNVCASPTSVTDSPGHRFASYIVNIHLVAQCTTSMQDVLSCPEKGLGMWLGSITVYSVYLVSCLFWAEFGAGKRYKISGSSTVVRLHDPLGLGGVDGEVDDTYLFWSILSLLVLAAAAWLKLAWLDTDPGIIDTRNENFEEVIFTSLCESSSLICHHRSWFSRFLLPDAHRLTIVGPLW